MDRARGAETSSKDVGSSPRFDRMPRPGVRFSEVTPVENEIGRAEPVLCRELLVPVRIDGPLRARLIKAGKLLRGERDLGCGEIVS